MAVTGKSLADLSADDVVRLCEINFIDYWRCAGDSENAEFREEHGVTFVLTGIQQDIFNLVLKMELEERDVESAIDSVMQILRSRKVPAIWHTGLTSSSRNIGKYLEARGYPHDYDLAAMAVDLGHVKDDFPRPDGLLVKEVRNTSDCEKWVECLAMSWDSPKQVVPWMMNNPCYNVGLRTRSGRKLPRKLYLATLDGKPVGTTMLNWTDEVAGLQKVGTLQSARNKGVGSALIVAALRDARALGFKLVVVLSTIEGVRLYSRIGFRTFGKFGEHSMHFER